MRGDIRGEWDDTKQHDVLFLLTIRPPDQAELAILQQDGAELHPAEKFGLAYVRGCEVLEVKDEGALPLTPCLDVHFLMALITYMQVQNQSAKSNSQTPKHVFGLSRCKPLCKNHR